MRSRVSHIGSAVDYSSMPLLRLIRRIASRGDRLAIDELHRRTPCQSCNAGLLTITDYLGLTRDARVDREKSALGKKAAEDARDLAADRFFRLPPRRSKGRGSGPNCRAYFRAFLTSLAERNIITPDLTALQAEQRVADELSGFVRWQFHLCFGETLRKGNPVISRYFWRPKKCPGRSVCVLMPKLVSGAERPRWLETHVPDVDLRRSGERQRIQSVIDDHLNIPVILSLEDFDRNALDTLGALHIAADSSVSDASVAAAIINMAAKKVSQGGFAGREVLARLGDETKEAFVRMVLENAVTEHYNDTQLAELLGVSKATFSRLMGDLRDFLKTALAAHPDFRDAVAGYRSRPRSSSQTQQPRAGEMK